MRNCLIIIVACLMFAFKDSDHIIEIETTHHTIIKADAAEIKIKYVKEGAKLYLPSGFNKPLTITAIGFMGGSVTQVIEDPMSVTNIKFEEQVLSVRSANPKEIPSLPKICPRVSIANVTGATTPEDRKHFEVFYDAKTDRLNHVPVIQVLEEDAQIRKLDETLTGFDLNNVLAVKHVEIRYDYEDSNRIDLEDYNPITGNYDVIYEGEGGFYANIHYAVVPYDEQILKYDTQTLLHMVQGTLGDINRKDLIPKLRTHGFIPGPFLSKNSNFYDQCEWGDTAYQAPVQAMDYYNMAIWDWDFGEHVLLIVWEGDEEDWLIQKQLIDPFYITDDFIGMFEIRKENTVQERTFTNQNKDFSITIQTNNIK